MAKSEEFKHVDFLWNAEYADTLDPLERLVYRSNLLGEDQRVALTRAGEASSKLFESDPLTGEKVEVLWIKGHGEDLRTATEASLAALYQERLTGLGRVAGSEAGNGGSGPGVRRGMLFKRCAYDPRRREAPRDTLLHAFVPHTHVHLVQSPACLAIASCRDGEKICREIYGDRVGWLPWKAPDLERAVEIREVCREHPEYQGLLIGHHGLLNWGEDDLECYELTLELVEKASRYIEGRDRGEKVFGGQKCFPLDEAERRAVLMEVMPWLRGQVSRNKVFVATKETEEDIQQFVNSHHAARLAALGAAGPDHLLQTKHKPLHAGWNPQRQNVDDLKELIAKGIDKYRRDYLTRRDASGRSERGPAGDPHPAVILVPGVGMIAFGRDKTESRLTAEYFNHAVEVMRGAEAISEYVPLSAEEAFDIAHPEPEVELTAGESAPKDFESRVVVVAGAASGIGRAVARRLIREGAHVVCADKDKSGADATAAELTEIRGAGLGMAGTGLSRCGPVLPVHVDITDRSSVETMFEDVIMAYGGLDSVIVTAGIFIPPRRDGRIDDDKWAQTFDVNVTGLFIVADEAKRLWNAQGMPGSLVLTTSVGAAESEEGGVAYNTSKAAANYLVRALAVDLAPLVRVNGLAPAWVVMGSTMLQREQIVAALESRGIAVDAKEGTDDLRAKLAAYYAESTLMHRPVSAEDQAEAACLLASERLPATTGQILNVDGGRWEAFPR